VLRLAVQAARAFAVGAVRAGAQLAGLEHALLAELGAGGRLALGATASRTTDERSAEQSDDDDQGASASHEPKVDWLLVDGERFVHLHSFAEREARADPRLGSPAAIPRI
jgi:hypothetical protein